MTSVRSRPPLPRTAVHAAFALALGLIAAALALAQPLPDDPSPLARRVKAAFLYKFLDYIEWPPHAFADSASPLVIGVLGADPAVAEVREVIGDRMAQGRSVVVRRYRDGDPLTGTHMLYVTQAETPRTGALSQLARGTGSAIVTESDSGLALGSTVNFRMVDGRVRFDIALGAAERAGLRISSRLLAVAHNVRTAP